MTKVAIVYHSGYGHTKLQAEAVRDGAQGVEGTEVLFLTAQEAEADLDRLDDADAIIFGAPTYMGSASAPMKSFMDATSKPWFAQKWKDKVAGGFTNSGGLSGDKVQTLEQFVILASQHGMIWVPNALGNETQQEGWASGDPNGINRVSGFLGAMAQSENAEPGPNNPPKGDIKTARLYGERIAKAAQRWGRGKLD
ncbi:flavodoxin family protein [Parvularcula oceani]|uniref:flavodoxin family protein n=1 Tax=Parvularcula oceani TaxID=1247963 RepID=UPI0004E1250C|nr:flavodoxin family protein [Parvularcula oceani]